MHWFAGITPDKSLEHNKAPTMHSTNARPLHQLEIGLALLPEIAGPAAVEL